MSGLDNVNEDIIDKAIQRSKESFQDYLHDQYHKIKFKIIKKLGSIDLGLTYNFCVDKSHNIAGVVWLTSVMSFWFWIIYFRRLYEN